MNEKNFPNWMLAAVVGGFGELTYWLWKRWGFGWPTKISLGTTAVVGLIALVIYLQRQRKRPGADHKQAQKQEKFENMTQ